MSPLVAAIVAGVLMLALLILLRRFGARHWIWQVLSLVLAMTVALLPLTPEWSEPGWVVLFGCTFLFLFFWAANETVDAVLRHCPRWLRRH
jgi:hypothetical protein